MGFTPGQVVGGRWKPLQHALAAHLYRDVISACGIDGSCFLRNDDALNAFSGEVALSFLHVSTSAVTPVRAPIAVSVPRGAAAFAYFCLSATGDPVAGTCASVASALTAAGCAADGSDCILLANTTSTAAGGASVDENWQLQAPPFALKAALPRARVTATVVGGPSADGSVPIDIATDAAALFVTLTSLAQGRFEPNFIVMPGAGVQRVAFLPFAGFDAAQLNVSLRVDHAAMYL